MAEMPKVLYGKQNAYIPDPDPLQFSEITYRIQFWHVISKWNFSEYWKKETRQVLIKKNMD